MGHGMLIRPHGLDTLTTLRCPKGEPCLDPQSTVQGAAVKILASIMPRVHHMRKRKLDRRNSQVETIGDAQCVLAVLDRQRHCESRRFLVHWRKCTSSQPGEVIRELKSGLRFARLPLRIAFCYRPKHVADEGLRGIGAETCLFCKYLYFRDQLLQADHHHVADGNVSFCREYIAVSCLTQ